MATKEHIWREVGPAASPRFIVGVLSGPPPKQLTVHFASGRRDAFNRPSPSPLGGERAGVRGVSFGSLSLVSRTE
jgi:hypothetical protein